MTSTKSKKAHSSAKKVPSTARKDSTELAEALKWAVQVAGDDLKPFCGSSELGSDNVVLCSYWHCHGCKGEFVSTWPKWEDEMVFPHEKECQYLKTLRVLGNALMTYKKR